MGTCLSPPHWLQRFSSDPRQAGPGHVQNWAMHFSGGSRAILTSGATAPLSPGAPKGSPPEDGSGEAPAAAQAVGHTPSPPGDESFHRAVPKVEEDSSKGKAPCLSPKCPRAGLPLPAAPEVAGRGSLQQGGPAAVRAPGVFVGLTLPFAQTRLSNRTQSFPKLG